MQNKFFEVLEQRIEKVQPYSFPLILSEVQRCDRVAIIKEGRILKVEQIDTLRATRYKRIMIEFRNADEGNKFDMPGITKIEKKNNHVEFLYAGDINTILCKLAQMNILNLLIEEPSLEEIFIHYYENRYDYEKEDK